MSTDQVNTIDDEELPTGSDLRNIPVEDVEDFETALRPVNRKDIKFQQLSDSVKQNGVLEPVLVRELGVNPNTKRTRFGLINGLQRTTAARDHGLKTIPANVVTMTDAEAWKAQIITNFQKIETKRAQYAKQLLRLLVSDNTLTRNDLANSLSVSEAQLNKWLNLANLVPEAAKLVDEGTIPLVSGYSLSKLPPEEQNAMLPDAKAMNSQEFILQVDNRAKQIKEANAKGKKVGAPEFVPTARFQKLGAVKEELENGRMGKQVLARVGVPANLSAQEAAEYGWQQALKFVLHQDPISIEFDKQRFEDMRKKAEERKRLKQQENDRKKLDKEKEAKDPSKVLLKM